MKFGQQYALSGAAPTSLYCRKWHLDEVVVTIKGKQYYLWRVVDADGSVLDVLMQRYRETTAAKRFFRKLLKRQGFTRRVFVTDKLKSYAQMGQRIADWRDIAGLNPAE